MSEAHYKCVVTGELLPEDGLLEVPVYSVEITGHNHFENEQLGSVYIKEKLVHVDYVTVEVLAAFGRPLMVYKEDLEYGRAYPVSEMKSEKQDLWQTVVDAV
jgi:hypothetical protein